MFTKIALFNLPAKDNSFDRSQLCFSNTLHYKPEIFYSNFGGPTCKSERTGYQKNEWYFRGKSGCVAVADSGTKIQVYASNFQAMQDFSKWLAVTIK